MAISICNTLTDVPCVFPVCSLQAGLHFSVYFKIQKHTLSLHAARPPTPRKIKVTILVQISCTVSGKLEGELEMHPL